MIVVFPEPSSPKNNILKSFSTGLYDNIFIIFKLININ